MAEKKLHEEKYVKIARGIVLRNIEKDRYHVFLFGSRADESCNYGSDIDIGILGEQPLGKLYYKIINELGAFRHTFRYIYQSELDIEKLNNLDKKLPEIIKEFTQCHKFFIENLQKIIKAL